MQLVGLVSGILIIRLMPVKEYAWYTIANTMLGTLTILSDGGISTGVMAEGGKVWNDKFKLGVVLATGMELRRKFAFFSLIVSLPLLIFLLYRQQTTLLMAVLIAFSLIPAFYASLSDTLLEIPLKLHQNIILLQKNQILAALGRLVLLILSLFYLPITILLLLANGIPRIWANMQLKKNVTDIADLNQSISVEVKTSILKLVRKLLPGAIYFSFSGQITIWLLSILGNSKSVAEIGALGRISMIFSLFNVLFSTLISPRFAKTNDGKKNIVNKFFLVQFFFILIFSILLLFSFFFSKKLLWILGGSYSHLKDELLLMILAGFLSLLAGFTYSLYTSRGWAIQPYIYLPINILAIVFGAFFFKIDSLIGVIQLSILTGIVQYIMNLVFSFYCFSKYI